MRRWFLLLCVAHVASAAVFSRRAKASQASELEQLRRLSKVLQLEEQAVDVLQRLEQHSFKQQNLLQDGNMTGHILPTGYNNKLTGDCMKDAFAITRDNPEGFCEIARDECRQAGAINYLELSYCYLPHHTWLSVLILITWLFVLAVWLSTTVDYNCPNLIMVAKVLGISDSVAGVTFLSLGNGSSDIFSMVSAALSGPRGLEMAVGEVIGNGMFVFCVVQGLVVLIAPFTVLRTEYLRDCGVYLIGLVLTFLCLLDGHVSIIEAVAFLLLYGVYLAVVINYAAFLAALGLHEPDKAVVAADIAEGDGLLAGGGDAAASGRSSTEKGPSVRRFDETDTPPAAQLVAHLVPVRAEAWAAASWPERALHVLRAPAVILQNLSVPVVDTQLANGRWSRPVVMCQMLCAPPLVYLMMVHNQVWSALQDPDTQLVGLVISGAVGVTLAGLVYLTSNSSQPPEYLPYLCFLGFGMSIQWIYTIADEIVDTILAIGITCHFENVLVGATLLAVGVGLQDLVTNIGITRSGHPNMAAAACVGSPVLNLLVGFGASSIAGIITVENPYSITNTEPLTIYLAFLVFTVILGVIIMAISSFRATTTYAVVLLSSYIAFVALTLLLAHFSVALALPGPTSNPPSAPGGPFGLTWVF